MKHTKNIMKYLLICALLLFSCKKNETSTASNQNTPKQEQEQLKPDLTKNYWHLEGKIGDIPVAMELIKHQDFVESGENEANKISFSGTYYYLSEEKPIQFYQKDSVFVNNKLNLNAVIDFNKEETFSGDFDGLTFKGTWESKGKKQLFELKETYASNQIPLQYFGISKNINFEENTATYNEEVFATSSNSLINDTIKKVMFGNTKGDINNLLHISLADYEKNYLEDMKNFKKEFGESSATNNYVVSTSFFPVVNTGKRMVFEHNFYEYTGGAHGNGGSIFYNYDAQQNKFLSRNDIFKSSKTELDKMVNNEVYEKYKLAKNTPLQDLQSDEVSFLVESVPFTDNFILTKKGIIFYYNPYEVGPYSMGSYQLYIPYEKMKPHLNTSFKY